jgi:TnpA family transposase
MYVPTIGIFTEWHSRYGGRGVLIYWVGERGQSWWHGGEASLAKKAGDPTVLSPGLFTQPPRLN